MRRSFTSPLAALVLLVGGPATADAGVRATERASGDYAVATVSADIDRPRTIRVRVSAAPKQRVSVSWTMTCSKGMGAGSKSGSFKGRTLLTRKLRKPMSRPANCIVAATAQLDGSGRIKVQILA